MGRASVLLLVSCAGSPLPPVVSPGASEAAPLGQLPSDVRPQHYRLTIEILPEQERFSGEVAIDVELGQARQVIWLHGLDLNVRQAWAEPGHVPASWEQVDKDGVAALRFETPLPSGKATLHLVYDAPFGKQLSGLYKVVVGKDAYAFTQFEAIHARQAFPCFDEPAFKTPFDVTLITTPDDLAFTNSEEKTAETRDGKTRRTFTTSPPLPTYLVAFAVGPLDVVQGEIAPSAVRQTSLPFRGIAARGRGAELQYAMTHTPKILEALERYFGSPHPYAKLDIVAVPDFSSGAMENAGLVTFREPLLLLHAQHATEAQRRSFAYVMAHELAHQWFGNLVTMPWWDDIWLNEAFATWMGAKIVHELWPKYQTDLERVRVTQGAMSSDSMLSARQIRQPIATSHDIRNAFDSITYQKGGAMLAMFERWLGVETFREGLRRYLQAHAWGTATYRDLLVSLGDVANKDVVTPFESFLFQPGVPLLDVATTCGANGATLHLTQSRYLHAGSHEDSPRSWKLPLCVRYESEPNKAEHSSCTLVTTPKADIPLNGGCPAWVLPNADAAGYLRFSLEPKALAALSQHGLARLSPAEKLAYADSMVAAVMAGKLPVKDAYGALEPLALEPQRSVATKPFGLISTAREEWVVEGHERVEAYARKLYRPLLDKLGVTPRPTDDSETNLLRAELLGFLAKTGQDTKLRKELSRLGQGYIGFEKDAVLHPDAVSPDLAGLALAVAVQDGGAKVFDATLVLLPATEDAVVRGNLITAMSTTRDPALSLRALDLALDDRLRVNEAMTPLWLQTSLRETRAAAWAWVKDHMPKLRQRFDDRRVGSAPFLAAGFCTPEAMEDVRSFFAPFIDELAGGPRSLAQALETIGQCVAIARAQQESARDFF